MQIKKELFSKYCFSETQFTKFMPNNFRFRSHKKPIFAKKIELKEVLWD